ncbi:MAG: glycosyltransferase family 2 protein [Candidatus Bathyarchaeia archaeon]
MGSVIEELKAEGFKRILVVDGYSTDRTVPIAQGKGARILYQHGKGKAYAVRTAIERIETPYILLMDADYTYDARDAWKLLEHGDRYDEVIGYRCDRRNIPRLNRLGNWIITKAFNLLTGSSLRDVCSGMYLLKTERARSLDIGSPGFGVEAEIAIQISAMGDAGIAEVPVGYRPRLGKPKLSPLKDGYRILATVFSLARTYNPSFLFAILTALALIPGGAIYAFVLYRLAFQGVWHSGWALLGTALVIFGGQGLILSMVSLLLKRMEKRILRAVREK